MPCCIKLYSSLTNSHIADNIWILMMKCRTLIRDGSRWFHLYVWFISNIQFPLVCHSWFMCKLAKITKKLTGPVRRILHPQNNVGALKDHRISMGCHHDQRPCPALPSCDDLSRHSGDRGHSGQDCNCGLFAISGHAKWFLWICNINRSHTVARFG